MWVGEKKESMGGRGRGTNKDGGHGRMDTRIWKMGGCGPIKLALSSVVAKHAPGGVVVRLQSSPARAL